VIFGVGMALILFFVGGRGSVDPVSIGLAAILGSVAGASFYVGASRSQPPSS